MPRECGSCTWCCYFMAIPEMSSPYNRYCLKCVPDEGCSIWEDRPDVCKNTNCLWKQQEQIPDRLRPDKLGVMIEVPANSRVWAGYIVPSREKSWRTADLKVLINKILAIGHPLIITCPKWHRNIHFLPEGWTEEDAKKELITVWERMGGK